MLKLFREEKLLYKLITLAVFAAAVFFVFRMIYAYMLAMPYPKELLEPSNISLTRSFLEGKDPYSLASLSYDVPGVNYDYMFLNCLIAAGIAKITGCGAVTAHFVISLLSILASAVLGFAIVSKYAKTTVAPTLSALVFMFCHWRFGYINATPDDLGTLLFILTLYAAAYPKIKNKPLVCAIGITLCFYTKQYFVFVAAPLFIYMWLYSKKDAIKLLAWTVGINTAVALVLTTVWPLLWTRVFFFTYIGAVVKGGMELATLFDQLGYLVISFAALFLLIVVAAIIGITRFYKNNGKLRGIKVKENDAFALSVVNTIVMIIPLGIIGRNDGAYVSYFLQLWLPSIVIVALVCYERLKPDRHELVFIAFYAAITAFTVYFGLGKLPVHILTSEEKAVWDKAYDYVSTYGEKGDIFYSRSLAYDYFMNGNGECLCGHDGDASYKTIEYLDSQGISADVFGYVGPIIEKNQTYWEALAQKAADHEYSLISFETDKGYRIFDDAYLTSCGYECIDNLSLQLGNMPYNVAFYALKQD